MSVICLVSCEALIGPSLSAIFRDGSGIAASRQRVRLTDPLPLVSVFRYLTTMSSTGALEPAGSEHSPMQAEEMQEGKVSEKLTMSSSA